MLYGEQFQEIDSSHFVDLVTPFPGHDLKWIKHSLLPVSGSFVRGRIWRRFAGVNNGMMRLDDIRFSDASATVGHDCAIVCQYKQEIESICAYRHKLEVSPGLITINHLIFAMKFPPNVSLALTPDVIVVLLKDPPKGSGQNILNTYSVRDRSGVTGMFMAYLSKLEKIFITMNFELCLCKNLSNLED
jgi:hypothetical protein